MVHVRTMNDLCGGQGHVHDYVSVKVTPDTLYLLAGKRTLSSAALI